MSNIDLTEQMNKLLKEQLAIIDKENNAYQNSLSILKQITEIVSKQQEGFQASTDEAIKLAESISKTSEETEKLGSNSSQMEQGLVKAMQNSSKETETLGQQILKASKNVNKLGLAGANAMDGFVSGIKLSVTALMQFGSLAKGVTGAIFNIGKAIITAPFKMLSSLLSSATGGSNELQQAIENVRKEFGNLHESSGKAILDIAKGMKGQLANTGLSVYRVFGNLAEKLATIAEYAKNMGVLFGVLAGQLVKNAEAIGAYYKGLGLTAEGQKAVGARAYAAGTQIIEVTREMANYSLQLGKAFGLSSKEISRDMGNMMADFTHFGHLGVQVLSQVSVYTRRLGVDWKALGSIMDKFANFEDAATGAAQLSQAFGLNIDAIQLMKEQDPAKKMEMLRKAFFAAGKSVETMTYQERRLLAAQSGVTEENLNLVFSLKNQGLSYADVQKKGAAAQKHQLTQVEVLKRLGDQIERLTKSGGGGASSFFEIWIKGFKNGITWSREFRGLMRNLHVDMRTTFIEGRKVGRMFVESFPGVKQFLGGLKELFDPARFRKMVTGTTAVFREFFKNFTNPSIDPAKAMEELTKKLKSVFFDWFSGGSASGQKMLNGIKSFFLAMSTIMGSLLKSAIEGLAKGVRFVVDFLKNPGAAIGGLQTGGGFIVRLIHPMLDAIKKAGPDLYNAFEELGDQLFIKLKDFLKNHWKGMVGFLFGPAVIGAAFRGIPALLASSLGGESGGAAGSMISVFSRMGTLGAAALAAAVVAGFIFFPEETERMFNSVIDKVATFTQQAGEAIGKFFGNGGATKIFNGFVKATEAILITLPHTIINGLLNGMRKGLQAAMPEYADQIGTIFSGIKTAYDFMFDMIKNTFGGLILVMKGVLSLWGFVITGIENGVRDIRSGVSIVTDLFGVMKSAVKSMFSVFTIRGTAAVGVTNDLGVAGTRLETTWGKVKTFFTDLFKGIREGIKGITDLFKSFTPPAWMTRISSAVQTFNQEHNIGGAGDVQRQAIVARQRAMDEQQARTNALPDGSPGANPQLISPPAVANVAESVENLSRLNTAMAQVSETQATAAIPVIHRMVHDTNEIGQALSTIRPMNLNSGLTRLANNIGLGNQQTFTVQHRNFQVAVNLNVHIDAQDLERILIERPGTRISNNSPG